MKRVDIDFMPPSLALGVTRLSAAGWLCGVIALSMLAWAGGRLWRLDTERDAVAVAQQALQSRARRLASVKPAPRPALPGPQVAAVNQAIGQLNLPWRDLFDAIETSTPAEIALLSLEPDARRHVLHGIAEAPGSAAMLDYIRVLRRHPFFAEAVLTRHEVNDKDPNHPLRFQFDVGWRTEQTMTVR